jgi:hypothetical protein
MLAGLRPALGRCAEWQSDCPWSNHEEGNDKIRRYLWVHECKQLVVLAKRSEAGRNKAYFLVTALYLY